ncbi:MAG: TIR domain-containing protein [Candidatus Cloacimonadales bacterium]
MGRKIFVSYKYADSLVEKLDCDHNTTVRSYVNKLQDLLSYDDHINKGEIDGEDMSSLSDPTIRSKLGDKIFDSSVTVVMISKGMKDNIPENKQWIPWEVSYSLREQSRAGRTCKTNALLAVIIPDEYGRYDYFMTDNPICNSTTYHTDKLFPILAKNMFNLKYPNTRECNGSTIYTGLHSYIHCVKWSEFTNEIHKYIETAKYIMDNKNDYNIVKTLEE